MLVPRRRVTSVSGSTPRDPWGGDRVRRTLVDMVRKPPDAVRITSATRSQSEDISARQRRYVLSMSIRTVCFLLGVLTMPAWYAWAFLVASIFLPYVAVVMANGSSAPDPGGPEPFLPGEGRAALGTAPRGDLP